MRTSISNKLINLILAACLVTIGGCGWRGIRGNGVIKTDQRPVGAFTILEGDGAFQIDWRPGAPALSITADENLLRYIKTTISGDKLQIESTERISPTRTIKVAVSSAALSGAQLNGAVRFSATQLAGEKFYIDSSGATRVTADGKVTELVASMTGASRLTADSLQTQTAELSLTGASRAEVAVADTLKVAITGAGKVIYSGNPRSVEKDVTGAGSIKHRD